MSRDFKQRFTENAQEFDNIMVDMLEEHKRLRDSLAEILGICNSEGAQNSSSISEISLVAYLALKE